MFLALWLMFVNLILRGDWPLHLGEEFELVCVGFDFLFIIWMLLCLKF